MANDIGCPDESAFFSLVNPTLSPSFLNPDYDPSFWDSWDKGPYTIHFYYDGSPVEFGKWYFPGSMVIESVDGFEPGTATFIIWDVHPDHFNLPFLPIGQMKVKIGNRNGTDWFFTGRVQDIEFLHFNRRTDGSENRRFKITCLDLKIDFKRWLITETYTDATTYSIIKDIVKHHTPFDDSLIDPTKGYTLKGYKINWRYAADAIQELLDLEINSTIGLNPDTLQVTVDTLDSPTFNFLTVTEDNIYDYFLPHEFFIAPQSMTLRNRVVFWFTGAHAEGTVNVTNGNSHIIGVGTKWLSVLRKGGKITLDGDTTQYSIADILSDTDILVSPAIERSTVSGITYSAYGYRDFIIVDDTENIATLAAILDESFERAGVFEVKMPERTGALTRDQARALGQAYVNRMVSNLIVRGQAKSKNYKINTPGLQAGWSMTVNLPISRNISATIKIAKLIMEDKTGGNINRILNNMKSYWDGLRIDPIHNLTFDFTDRRLLTEAVLERTLQDIREVQITDDSIVYAAKLLNENLYLSDCFGIVPSVGPNGIDTPEEELTLTDYFDATEVDPSVEYYAAPVGPGQTEAYTTSTTTISFCS